MVLRYLGTTELIQSDFDIVSNYNDGANDYTVHQFTWDSTGGATASFTVIPEPSSALLAVTFGGLMLFRRKRNA